VSVEELDKNVQTSLVKDVAIMLELHAKWIWKKKKERKVVELIKPTMVNLTS